MRADLRKAKIDPDPDVTGRRVDMHALRHTYCTLIASSGARLKAAQQLMQHASADTTLKYAKAEVDPFLAAAVKRLERETGKAKQARGVARKVARPRKVKGKVA